MKNQWLQSLSLGLLIMVVAGAPGLAAEKKQDNPDVLESRMELILEFDAMVAQYLDLLFQQKVPNVALMEWCEKAELRGAGYPKVQQACGELYASIKSCIKGDIIRARMSLQQALWLMASERYSAIQSAGKKEISNPIASPAQPAGASPAP